MKSEDSDHSRLDHHLTKLRREMVLRQIKKRGIRNPDILCALESVPRHEFVSPTDIYHAYDDVALPIGYGQTISQPFMVATMTNALNLTGCERVLEIGAGSGYQAAVLSPLCSEVIAIERIPALAHRAKHTLHELGYNNVQVISGDGTERLSNSQAVDVILVSAAARKAPQNLLLQLGEGQHMIIPIGSKHAQTLTRFTRQRNHWDQEKLCACVFVPLISDGGWQTDERESNASSSTVTVVNPSLKSE